MGNCYQKALPAAAIEDGIAITSLLRGYTSVPTNEN